MPTDRIPALVAGDRLTRDEFERRYERGAERYKTPCARNAAISAAE